MSNLNHFIGQYNWKEIDFLSEQKDWKIFELNNKSIVNMLFVPQNTEKICIQIKT